MKRNKRGAMEISVGAIVVLILAITFLSLGLVFIKGMLGKMFMRFDEQISQEPEPPKPTLSHHITLSRNPVKTTQDTAEVVKISVLNPSQSDWYTRKFVRTEGMCGKVDGICFIDINDNTGKCDTKSNAVRNDPDCETGIFVGMDCNENSKKSPCLISNIYEEEKEGGGDMYCPMEPGKARDEENCKPKEEGVEVYLTCPPQLMEKPFKRSIGSIETGDFKTNILLLKLNKKIPEDQYLCQLRVFAEDKEYMEDLIIDIKNE